jgi:NADPH:quinone reductase-like Zn-dependent oxidoreductase
MRAAVITGHGGADVVAIRHDLPGPEVGAGQVRIQIKAAALNRLDLWVRGGWPGLKLRFPHVICADGAGVVDAVGSGVTQFQVGDRVCIDPTILPDDSPGLMTGLENQSRDMGILSEDAPGVAAELVVLPQRNLLKMPDSIGYTEAAAAGLVYVTAWHSLISRGKLQPGESVLIVGAGGGVNSASIQIAKLTGATVYVVGSNAEKCARAQEYGADYVINRAETPDWSKVVYQLTGKQGVDVVVDNVGGGTLPQSMRAAKSGGRILIVGNTSGQKAELDVGMIFSKHLSLIGSTMGPHRDYVQVMNLVFAGKLKPVVGAVYPLEDAAAALNLLEAFDVFGKVVLEV